MFVALLNAIVIAVASTQSQNSSPGSGCDFSFALDAYSTRWAEIHLVAAEEYTCDLSRNGDRVSIEVCDATGTTVAFLSSTAQALPYFRVPSDGEYRLYVKNDSENLTQADVQIRPTESTAGFELARITSSGTWFNVAEKFTDALPEIEFLKKDSRVSARLDRACWTSRVTSELSRQQLQASDLRVGIMPGSNTLSITTV